MKSRALSAYVHEILHELHETVSYTGEDMMTEVEGGSLQRDNLASKLVFAFHDEYYFTDFIDRARSY